MEVVPARRRVEKPTVNASGSSPPLRGRASEEEMSFTAQDNYPDSHPGGRLQVEGEPRGKPGHLTGNPLATGEPVCPHTLVTMTIQLQPPVALAADYPIRLVSFLFIPGLHPIPSNSLPACRGRGRRKEEGVLSVTLEREGRPYEGLAAGTVGGRGGVSGREEWRSGKRKRENGWSGKTGEGFECNSRLIRARCSW